jgi:tetratricopeptide (TPR) repeat protein
MIQLGDRSLERGELNEAERLYHEALQKDPQSAEALYSIGCVAARRGDYSASLDWARQALEVEPTHAGALNLASRTRTPSCLRRCSSLSDQATEVADLQVLQAL